MPRKKPVPSDKGQLLGLIEQLEELRQRKAEIAAEISAHMRQARASGFDPWAIRVMLKERRQSETVRREARAVLDVYRATLGMLDGTPLGDEAKKRLAPKPDEDDASDLDAPAEDARSEEEAADLARDLQNQKLTAKAEGAAAAKAGRKVLDNPYHGGDPRRAAWDEGWCAASASDGMDIPAAWRRSKPPKPAGKSDGKGH